jgi:septal ring factor EnvC (AmiA/AmiB activator)
MRELSTLIFSCCLAASVAAQAQKPVPVEEVRGKDSALIQAQQRAEFAYRQLQQAQYDRKLAEQDYVNTQDAYRSAQQNADDLKRQVDAMKRALDAAKSRETAARQAYEKELDAVDRLPRSPRP